MTEENPKESISEVAASPENPHSLGAQLTGIVISSLIIIALFFVGGVLLSLVGVFTFLDAWNSGIYKTPGKRAVTNMSPMGWGIAMMLLFIITYPIYLLRRNRLKTKDGPKIYWVLLHIFSAVALLVTGLQVFVALSGGAA